ncbi:MAG: PRC-barrel domain containing protein, partial [Streptomycetaceae bacterium]|nr:PRC-barrel domain containing protein [Streptomycetaceae bacterium]
MSEEMWGYRPQSGHDAGLDMVGFKVEALDGQIGRIDKHSGEVGGACLVVDIGVWIFGKHVLLPAGLVSGVDVDARRVFVEASKSQIESA